MAIVRSVRKVVYECRARFTLRARGRLDIYTKDGEASWETEQRRGMICANTAFGVEALHFTDYPPAALWISGETGLSPRFT